MHGGMTKVRYFLKKSVLKMLQWISEQKFYKESFGTVTSAAAFVSLSAMLSLTVIAVLAALIAGTSPILKPIIQL